MKFGQIPTMLIALAVVCTGLALTFDLAMPLGVAAGVPYALLVLIGIWFPKRRHVLLLASVVSLLVVAGYLFSPKGGQDWVVLTNRALALGMIWLTAFLICFLKTAQFEGIETYRYLVQASPVCIHEIDLEGKLVSMNPAGLKMMDANDISEIRGLKYLDIPVAEIRIQPDAVPTPKGTIGIVTVMPGQFVAQVRGLINRLDISNRGHRNIFDKNMGSESYDAFQVF